MIRNLKLLKALAISSRGDNLEELVCSEDPQETFNEVTQIVLLMFPKFDLGPVRALFEDIIKLFRGKYPGYRECNTRYHDLQHTMDCLLAMTRLIHGTFLNGIIFLERDVTLGLISALMHDTGYIQSIDDNKGTGGKYTLVHINRSIDFMEKYFFVNGYSPADFRACRNFLKCTGLDVNIDGINFKSWQHKILGKILVTADLLGQMADPSYLEKLPFLYEEFKEGGVPGFDDVLDLLSKTPKFWEFTRQRFGAELGNVYSYLRDHFKVRWGLDRDLYREAIESNIKCLRIILEDYEIIQEKYMIDESLITESDKKGSHLFSRY